MYQSYWFSDNIAARIQTPDKFTQQHYTSIWNLILLFLETTEKEIELSLYVPKGFLKKTAVLVLILISQTNSSS